MQGVATWRVRNRAVWVLVLFLLLALGTPRAHAQFYPLEVFTTNGLYSDDPGLDLIMELSNGEGVADFLFYNNSTIDCSLARIYFDDGTLLGITDIATSAGVEMSEIYPGPGNLPSGGLLDPPFVADREFSIGGEASPSEKGIDNPGEWVKITFELVNGGPNGGTLDDVISELNDGTLRVGVHILAFPDGSSEAAVAVPEPATICLLGLGALVLLRKRRN